MRSECKEKYMCGIAGFYNAEGNYQQQKEKWASVLTSMHECLAHRGNDESGIYLSDMTGLSHARLSIRDIVTGKQPIIRQKNGKEYAIVYNGELYNTGELARDLRQSGYEFSTTTDTEVILYAYMQYGASFVRKLNGIFAFAIWDDSKKQLLLYRDRVGIKPLFYSFVSGQLLFASEPKALFCFPGFTPRVSMDGMREVLAIGPARTMGNGIFDDINEVLPGHYLIFSENTMSDHTYWDLFRTPHTDSYEQTVETVSFLLRDSVTRQMVSDVPVCTFLSGGIDSSIVTAIACRYMEKHGETLNTFSFDFKDNDIYFKSNAFQPERDLPYVKIMLDHYHTNHTYLECDENTLFSALRDAVDAKDFPGMTDVDSSLLYFCSLVKKHNKVALTGECADEVFGGYPWFHRESMLDCGTFPWTPTLAPRKSLLNADFANTLRMEDYVKNAYDRAVSEVDILPMENETETSRRRIGYLSIRFFMQTLLNRMDRTSMNTGLEARVPFADKQLVSYVFNIPWEMKAKGGLVKNILRQSAVGLLPDEILFRKKSPYPKTYNPYYENLLSARLKEVLSDGSSPLLPLLDHTAVQKFLDNPKDYGQPWYGQLMAGPQMTAYLLQIHYWLTEYHVTIL